MFLKIKKISKQWRNPIVHDVSFLYIIHFFNYFLPILIIPFLTRILGAQGWGLIAFTLAFAQYVTVIVEYGFHLSATREAARHRDNKAILSKLFSSVLSAKILIAALFFLLSLTFYKHIPIFKENPILFKAGVFLAISQALNVSWFFRGINKLKVASLLEIGAKALGIISAYFIIKTPSDGWKFIMVNGVFYIVFFIIGLILIYRFIPIYPLRFSTTLETLKLGWNTFLIYSSGTIYTSGNVFILGFIASPEIVGLYSSVEKISRIFANLLDPVRVSIFPHLSYLIFHNQTKAIIVIRSTIIIMSIIGLSLGIIAYFTSDFLVSTILGPDFIPAVPTLKVLAPLPLFMILSNLFAVQWLLPQGIEKPVVKIILAIFSLNIILALILVPKFHQLGMGITVVSGEFFLVISLWIYMVKNKLNPFSRKKLSKTILVKDFNEPKLEI